MAVTFQPDRVSRRRRNPVIVRVPVLALFGDIQKRAGREEPQFPCALNGRRAIADSGLRTAEYTDPTTRPRRGVMSLATWAAE
jgi:hypothetical protein